MHFPGEVAKSKNKGGGGEGGEGGIKRNATDPRTGYAALPLDAKSMAVFVLSIFKL